MCHQFVTNVVVRIPWSSLAEQYKSQPRDASKAFCSLLLELVLRCAVKESNYAVQSIFSLFPTVLVMRKCFFQDCKASLPLLLDAVSTFDWECLDEDGVQRILTWAAAVYRPQIINPENTGIPTCLVRYAAIIIYFAFHLRCALLSHV